MSPTDRWTELEAHLEEVARHLAAIREDTPDWAKLAVVNHEERVHRLVQKLAAARTVLDQ